ncbi:MAG: hypothetical protein E7E82_03765 [Paraclostridium bifermentans]|nr:hypothetical protein [Paraclostridium bifermentans]
MQAICLNQLIKKISNERFRGNVKDNEKLAGILGRRGYSVSERIEMKCQKI